MLSRRSFLKRSTGVAALLAMGVDIAPVQAAINVEEIIEFVGDALPQAPYMPYETTWKPVIRQALADNRNICPLHLSSYYPLLENVHIPAIYRTGVLPTCEAPASLYDNAFAFQSGNDPVILNPQSFVKAQGMLNTFTEVEHNTEIPWQTWRDLAAQPAIDLSTRKLQVIGEWGLEVSEATTSSRTSPGQIPETPVDWNQWLSAEEGFEIGRINDELGPDNRILLELSPEQDLLWTGFIEEVSLSTTLVQQCSEAAGLGIYYVELQTVFPYVDHRGPIPIVEVWGHIKHVDPRLSGPAGLCEDDEYTNWQFIKLDTLLAATIPEIRREAMVRVERRTRVWPISLEFQPVFGGLTQEQLAQIAVVTIGALVLIALVVVIATQPQFILVAAVAL